MIFSKFLKLIRAKKFFTTPPRSDLLIFDSAGGNAFNNCLKNVNHSFLNTRLESINLYIIMKLVFKLKKINIENYFLEYIKTTRCKLLVTFIDNNPFFYTIKNHLPHLKIISIQNGMTQKSIFDTFKKFQNLQSDYIFTFGETIAKKFKEFIKTETIVIGSLRNNDNLVSKVKEKRKSIAFVSTGYSKKNNYIYIDLNNKLKSDFYYAPEKRLLPKLHSYCIKNKYQLEIIGAPTDLVDEKNKKENDEFEFYKKILNSNDFVFHPHNKNYRCYQIADEVDLVVNIYSAFGLESIARNTRTVIFNLRDQCTKNESITLMWPGKFSSKGDFWTDSTEEDEVTRVLNYALLAKEDDWNNTIKKIIPSLIYFDKSNKIFTQFLNKLL